VKNIFATNEYLTLTASRTAWFFSARDFYFEKTVRREIRS